MILIGMNGILPIFPEHNQHIISSYLQLPLGIQIIAIIGDMTQIISIQGV